MRNNKNKLLLIDPHSNKYHEQLIASLSDCEIILMPDKHEAYEFFFHNSVDLVLLDCNNGFSDFELIQYFKSMKPFVPVIIITSNSSEEMAIKAFRLGASDYFKKPFAANEVIESINKALGITYIKCTRRNDNIGRAVYYINKYYNANIRLSHASREAGMSVSCFGNKFKRKTGMTFIRYVNELRITKAVELLGNHDLSMGDIAFACGFTNQCHFTRAFKKICSISPARYRKTLKNQNTVKSQRTLLTP